MNKITIHLKDIKYSEFKFLNSTNITVLIYFVIPITVPNLILIILTIIDIYKFRMPRTLTESKLLKDQSVNTPLNSLKR